MPAQAPPASALEIWLRTPRTVDAPGIYGYGHTPRPGRTPSGCPPAGCVGGAVLSLLTGLLVWSLCWNGYLPFWIWPLIWFTPDDWRSGTGNAHAFAVASNVYYVLFALLLACIFGRLGSWAELWRRYARPALGSAVGRTAPGRRPARTARPTSCSGPNCGRRDQHALAERLAAEVRTGRMNDVDYTRILRAWTGVRHDPARLDAFTDAVLRQGAAACGHPSGERDLPYRGAPHDLLPRQVRIGVGKDDERNPYQHRGSGIALDPALLGTGLLAVGPPGSGKTRQVVRPVVESLGLQALAGQAAVVAVGAAGADLGPADALRRGDHPRRPHLPLRPGPVRRSTDPDTAAGTLAEALLDAPHRARRASCAGPPPRSASCSGRSPPRTAASPPSASCANCSTAPRTPSPPCARPWTRPAQPGMVRELDARAAAGGPPRRHRVPRSRTGSPCSTGPRSPGSSTSPAAPGRSRCTRWSTRCGSASTCPSAATPRPSRILARLVLAQFTAAVTARRDRSLFACLVLDDAAHTVTADAVRGLAAAAVGQRRGGADPAHPRRRAGDAAQRPARRRRLPDGAVRASPRGTGGGSPSPGGRHGWRPAT